MGKTKKTKWYWLTGHTPKTDLFLLHIYHEDSDPALTPLPELARIPRCPGCNRYDEEQIVLTALDESLPLPMQQDVVSGTNDCGFTLVTDRFRDACEAEGITGVAYYPCGQSKSRGRVYVLWPMHFTPVLAPLLDWCRNPSRPFYVTYCEVCHRASRSVGLPYQCQLQLPDPDNRLISLPSISTEGMGWRNFFFLCSDTVRRSLKKHSLKGAAFGDLRDYEQFNPPPEQWKFGTD